jgi:Inner membrane protein YgaP-like, transmembrane domain
MKADRIVHVFAGLLILVTLLLGAPASPLYVSSYILWITVFVGANLFQSGITRFCPLETILIRAGICKN